MKTFTILKNKYWPHLWYYLNRIGIVFTDAYIYHINTDEMELKEPEIEDITIRECKIEDLNQFQELEDDFKSYIMDGHTLIAAFFNDQWAGYMWIGFKPSKVTEIERIIHFNGAYLWNSFVKEEYRNRGIAKKMYIHSLNQIKDKYKEAYSIALTGNIPSIKTLESTNFTKTGFLKYRRFLFFKRFIMDFNGDELSFEKI